VDARAQKLEPPAIVVIGDIIKLRDELAVAEPGAAAESK
jgi:siroheme synthase